MLQELFTTFSKLNVLIIGDVMLDRYLYGKIDRISPEAPVPIVRLEQTDHRLGGAGNVALNIQSLGAKPFLCGLIGKDESGKIITNLLPQYGIDSNHLSFAKSKKTTVKTRVLTHNQQLIRLDVEDTHEIEKKEALELLTIAKKILDDQAIDALIFQDYNKGVLSPFLIKEALKEARKRNIPTVVDPKQANFFAYQNANLFKPNLREIKAQVPFPIAINLPDLDKAADYLYKKLNNPYTLITLSDKGVYLNDRQTSKIIPTTPRLIADVCGAGDAVISIAALGVASKLPLEAIAQLSNLAGGQVCEKVGVVPVEKRQLLTDYLQSL